MRSRDREKTIKGYVSQNRFRGPKRPPLCLSMTSESQNKSYGLHFPAGQVSQMLGGRAAKGDADVERRNRAPQLRLLKLRLEPMGPGRQPPH